MALVKKRPEYKTFWGPTPHSLPPDTCEVIKILGEIEDKIATFEPKFASLESLQQEMANRIIKVEMAKDVTVANEKLANLEKEISQVAKENVKITTFQQEISNLELAQQKCVEEHTEVTKQIPNLKPDSFYADLVNKQVDKKMLDRNNEIITSFQKEFFNLQQKCVEMHTEVTKYPTSRLTPSMQT